MFVSQKSFIYVIAIACPSQEINCATSIPLPGNPIGPNPKHLCTNGQRPFAPFHGAQIHPTIPEAKKHFNSVRRCPSLEAGHNGTRDTLEQDDRGVQTSWVGAKSKYTGIGNEESYPHLWKRKIIFPATFKGEMLVPKGVQNSISKKIGDS